SPMRGWVAGARVFGSPGWSHAGASEDSSPGHPLIKHACATSDLIHSTQQTGLVPRILCRRARSGPAPINPPPEQPVVVTHAPFPLIELENVRSILIVKLDHLGDVLLTIPAMRRLRELCPEARITALVGNWAQPLIEAEPCIDDALVYDF